MRKFGKRFSFLVAALMLLTMLTVALTSSAADNAKVLWDFSGSTEDIALWESEARLWAYDPWSTADLEIEDGRMVIYHMHQDAQCNSLDLTLNDGSDNFSGYKSVAFWIDTTELDRAFTIKISIIDFANNFISITKDAPYALYPDNGQKQDLIATADDPNWVFLTLPEKFKGYIEMPFESMKVLNWNADNKKNIDDELLSQPFRLLLEFNNATDGEVTRLDDVQLIKEGNPIGWKEGSGTPSSQDTTPSSQDTTPSNVESETTSSEDTNSEESEDVSDETSDESEQGEGSVDSSEDTSEDESKTSSSKKSENDKGGNTGLIVALIIIGVAVVAGGGFAAYKFVTSKK